MPQSDFSDSFLFGFFSKGKKITSVLATLLLFAGFVFAFLPHTTHATLGFDKESYLMHTVLGMGIVVIALLLLVWSSGARISFKK